MDEFDAWDAEIAAMKTEVEAYNSNPRSYKKHHVKRNLAQPVTKKINNTPTARIVHAKNTHDPLHVPETNAPEFPVPKLDVRAKARCPDVRVYHAMGKNASTFETILTNAASEALRELVNNTLKKEINRSLTNIVREQLIYMNIPEYLDQELDMALGTYMRGAIDNAVVRRLNFILQDFDIMPKNQLPSRPKLVKRTAKETEP